MPAYIPLIATGASLAYDQIVSKPEREAAAGKLTDIQQANYDKQVAERQKYIKAYEEFLASPVQAYDQGVIDAKLAVVKSQLKERTAEQRPQILQNLATRGVRTSGISEYPLTELESQNAKTYGDAVSNFTLEQLIAQRTAEQNRENQKAAFLNTLVGGAPSTAGVTNAQSNQALMPMYNDQMMQSLMRYLGMSTAYAMQPGTNVPAQTAQPMDWSTLNLYNRNLGQVNSGPLSLTNPGAKTSSYLYN